VCPGTHVARWGEPQAPSEKILTDIFTISRRAATSTRHTYAYGDEKNCHHRKKVGVLNPLSIVL